MTTIAQFETRFVQASGFSNGWAELTLKNPPPFVPSCLMAIWLATGPPGMSCVAPSRPTASVKPSKFCTTPRPTRMSASRATAAGGCASSTA